ncbi:oligosaccharide flippase family protein [Scytonema millei]|uniref:Oligosaccharide flippase family protein n=1 Tax=Scytonema millei VB511283 TaxID=1245923 RepID=A0A9X5I6T0_9CYAN|nr:oligosaccharide flippase family protein [Scytonema millei]NHC37426.1 oligosaccharide flippase family protein [Scytonema millei VB511283]
MSEQRNLVINSLSMLVNRLTQGIATFVLTATIARTLGAHALGQYLLAFSYYYMFMSIASQGLKSFFTRQLSRELQEIPVYLVNGTLLQLLFSIIGYLVLVAVVFALPYSSDTSTICYIMGLTIIPFSLSNITEAIFQAQEKMHLIALSTVPIYILRLLVMIWAINLKYGVDSLAAILVISEILILIIEWCLAINIIGIHWQIKQDFIWKAIKNSRTFLALEAIGIIAGRMQILILSLLGSELLVGLYGAIEQLMQPYYILCDSILLATFPKMSKLVELGKEKQRQFGEGIIQVLLCIVLPLIIGMLILGNDLLNFIYKDPTFKEALLPFDLVALTLLTFTFSRSCGYILIANSYEKLHLFEVVSTTILGGISGIFFISQYKLIGAAYMAIVISLSSTSMLVYSVYNRLFSFNLWNIMRYPIIISVLMLPVFTFLKLSGLNFLAVLVTATFIYAVLVKVLSVRVSNSFSLTNSAFFKK